MKGTKEIKLVTADPSAMGLFGLAIVTLVASSQKLGWTDGLGLVLPWVFFLGGIAQFYASILDSKRNNTFGATAFGAYGLFWMAVGFGWLVQAGIFGDSLATVDTRQLGIVYLGYLAIGILSLYGAGASVLNKHFGFDFLPLGKPFGIIKERRAEKSAALPSN